MCKSLIPNSKTQEVANTKLWKKCLHRNTNLPFLKKVAIPIVKNIEQLQL